MNFKELLKIERFLTPQKPNNTENMSIIYDYLTGVSFNHSVAIGKVTGLAGLFFHLFFLLYTFP